MLERLINLFDNADIKKIDDNRIIYYGFYDENDENLAFEVDYDKDCDDGHTTLFSNKQVESVTEISPGKFNIIDIEGDCHVLEFYKIIPCTG